ncbi:FMN reductase [Actinoplanes lutulentus]|uniref:FMN reductase n=1 Tax=Actinoplanes lutulentus TaxID=1287878 RepID=A0A327ZJ24_9ACTN|nr:NAD(P)H-dependent oxidoreductase [Actinoplanes lutulentus]MBB2947404.1 FMN reductase [Actinoplanes lutulentus]RAK36678.1 FMN reductase [Actinoplanes lutulentus]
MSDVVVLSGHPHPGSRTLQLATALGERLAVSRGGTGAVIVDVSELGPGLLVPGDAATGEALLELQDATVLIVATPAYRSTFSGVLKVLLDQLPANALAGVLAIPVVTADLQAQADVAEAFLARLLSDLGADVVDFGLTAIGPELADPASAAELYTAALIS